MMRGAAEIQKRAAQVSLETSETDTINGTIQVEKLNWDIPAEFVEKAEKDISWVTDDQQATFAIPNIGSQAFTKHGVKPVPAFILALQMAARELTGEMANISQFMTMSRYRCMDLTNAIVTTPEVARFTEYALGEDMHKDEARKLLDQAIKSQTEVAHNARATLPFSKILALYVYSKKSVSKTFTSIIIALSMILLRVLGYFKQPETDIVVSHPAIFDEIPVVGRPGIRLPYVKYFGLHYQLMPDKTVITMMPAVKWNKPNQEVIESIKKNLEKVLWVISDEQEVIEKQDTAA